MNQITQPTKSLYAIKYIKKIKQNDIEPLRIDLKKEEVFSILERS